MADNKPDVIEWCDEHWQQMIFALQTRGCDASIARSVQEQDEKFRNGDSDALVEAVNMINLLAIQVCGIAQIVQKHDGCPVCALGSIIDIIANQTAAKYLGTVQHG